MAYDVVIKGGYLITASDSFVADLAIAGEQIAAIGADLSGRREIDARGLYVLPGAVDGHVHLSDPTFLPYYPPTADTFETGSVAAAYGGVTTLIDFAQPEPGQSLLEGLDIRQEAADGHTVIDYSLHLNLRDPDPARLAEFPAVYARGVPSFKLYMAYDGYRLPDVALFRAMEAIAALNGLAIIHAENFDIIQELRQRLNAAGQTGPPWHAAACPAVTEGEAVHRALAYAQLAGAKVLIFHISCAEAAREVQLAKGRGQAASGETCPQYLVLTAEIYERGDVNAWASMINPPIRDVTQQQALWLQLAAGVLDVVSTDHCPVAVEPGRAWHPSGTSGIETRLALLHNFGVRMGRLSLSRWVDVCCTRPAQVFGLARKGQLAPGYDADVVLFDPTLEKTLSPPELHSAIDFATYDGVHVVGWPVTTLSRGGVIVEGGRLVEHQRRGRFVERGY